MERKGLLGTASGEDQIASQVQGDHDSAVERACPGRGRTVIGAKGRLQASLTFRRVSAHHPETKQRPRQTQDKLALTFRLEPIKRRPKVVMVGLQPVQPFLRAAAQVRLGLLRERQEMMGMPPAYAVRLARLLETLAGELTDRFQHPEAFLASAHEALVDKSLKRVEVGVRDRLSRLDGAAPCKNGKGGKEPLLLRAEQVVAPFDRRPQSPLTCLSIAAALEQIETLRDPLQDLPRRQYRRARGSELERQRQVVEDSAECGDGCVGLDTRPLTEEVDRLRFGERQHAVLDFASDAQALPTRDEDAEIRARFEQRREVGSRFDDLLEVVEQEQHLAVADVGSNAVLGTERLPDGLNDEGRIA